MKNIVKNLFSAEFSDAFEYSEQTKYQLTEREQFYADELIKQGYEVRFNETKVFNRKGKSGNPVSILRNNLN